MLDFYFSITNFIITETIFRLILPVHNHRLHSVGDLKICMVVYSPRRDGGWHRGWFEQTPVTNNVGRDWNKVEAIFRHTSINLVDEKFVDLVGQYKYDAEDADCIDHVPSSSDVGDDSTNWCLQFFIKIMLFINF